MIDPQWLRREPERIRNSLRFRGEDSEILEHCIALDAEIRTLRRDTEDMQRQRNENARTAARMRQDGGDVEALVQAGRRIAEQLRRAEGELRVLHERWQGALLQLPNLVHESVPAGCASEDNTQVRSWGEPRTFDFTPCDHVELGERAGLLDFKVAARLSGSRFVLLRGAGARLHRALAQFMLDIHTREHGYTEMNVPLMVHASALEGTGQLPKFEHDVFRVADQFYLVPTAEVPLTNIVRESILSEAELPMRLVAHTPCFRSEAGSYGQDIRGMIRQHQFEKVELVWITRPEDSYAALETLTVHAEEILRRLELPYRVQALCGGDLGFAAAKTYDLEVWLPGQNCYREISSCSNCEDFQARRMQARWRPAGAKPCLVHTLNGSGVAIGRALVAVLENGQQADGSILIPSALRPYMDRQEYIPAPAGA